MLVVTIGRGQSNPVEAAIVKTFEAMAELNIDKMKSYCTDDIIIIENGPIWNMDTLTKKLLPGKADPTFKRVNKIDFINTKIEGNTAWTYYYNQATGISNSKPFTVRWIESAVLFKEKGIWKIKFLHSTLLERK